MSLGSHTSGQVRRSSNLRACPKDRETIPRQSGTVKHIIWYHDVSTSHNFWPENEITNSRIPWTSPKKCWIPWLSLPWHWYPLTSLEKELHRLHANQAKLHHPGTEVPVLSTCSQHKSRDLPNALVTAVFLHPSSLVPRSSLENRSQASLSDWSDRNASWAAKTDQKGSGSSLSHIESLLREVRPGFAVLPIAKHHHFWKKLDHEPWFFLFRTESRKSVCAPYSTWVQALLLHSEKWIW